MTNYHELNSGEDTPHFEKMISTAIDTELLHTWTALPALVKNFYPDEQTVDLRIGILQEFETPEGEIETREHPVLIRCPIFYPSGSGYSITYPLNVGDTGIVIFASRCLDSWLRSGGVQKLSVRRKHSISDGIFFPGVRPTPSKIENFSTDGIEIRDSEATQKIRIDPEKIKIETDKNIEISAIDVTITGNLHIVGDLNVNGVDVGATHKHSGVTTGAGVTGPPV